MVKNFLSIIRLVIINAIVIILILLTLEFATRLYAQLFIPGKKFFRESSFTSPWISSYDDPAPFIDEQGQYFFKNKSTPVTKNKQDKIRVIAVGGSTTLNQRPYAAAGYDYSKAVEELLNNGNTERQYEVLNAGADAYSSAQSLINIQLRLVEFKPDIIILMHNINDRTVNYFASGATGDYGNKYLHSYFINTELQAGLSLSGFLYQSRFLTKIGIPQLLADKREISYENSIKTGLQIFKRNLAYIADVTKHHDIKLLLLSQPHLLSKASHPSVLPHIEQYNAAIKEVSQAKGVEYLDMYDKIGQREQLFIDTVHYSPDGINEFAKILAPKLREISP